MVASRESQELRRLIPPRLFDALDRRDAGFFVRYWDALPKSGRHMHHAAAFVYAALTFLGEERRTGAQRFADDQRRAAQHTTLKALNALFH